MALAARHAYTAHPDRHLPQPAGEGLINWQHTHLHHGVGCEGGGDWVLDDLTEFNNRQFSPT
jgi:hypothetical protein